MLEEGLPLGLDLHRQIAVAVDAKPVLVYCGECRSPVREREPRAGVGRDHT